MNRTTLPGLRFFVLLCFCLFVVSPLHAVQWFPLGPYGGDARSFAADPRDPRHLFLGTATGWVYDSHDGGATWQRIAQIDSRNDLVIDHILADPRNPKRLIVGAWTVDRPDGGLWISEDSGKTWYSQIQMHGQSVRALARSASNPNDIVAGTLRGVFLSSDNGIHWKQISPENSTEIHEVESIAIDPGDPDIIYAGTWHLPWKTTDGGKTWVNIKRGIIDDSDVFSIIVDPADPKTVYASACSGIYKSTDSAAEFHKIQGIPSTARRTRKLAQDPEHLATVYAGTTEGLYRTLDAGEHWDRMTGSDLIVNDVYVDPANSNHVLLATDRGGVLASDDAATSFRASNTGFSARQVTSYAADAENPATLYVGVVNDKTTGGVFVSDDGGLRWEQQSSGLGGRDVFALVALAGGGVLAGTNHGIFRLSAGSWLDAGTYLPLAPAVRVTQSAAARPVAHKPTHTAASRPAPKRPHAAAKPAHAAAKPSQPAGSSLDAMVFSLVSGNASIYAGTSLGLLRSDVDAQLWQPVPSLDLPEVRFIAVHQSVLLAAGLKTLRLSRDTGATWTAIPLPEALTQVGAVAVDDDDHLWAGGREGLFVSADAGASWSQLANLHLTQVDAIFFDHTGDRLLITTADSPFVFAVHIPDSKISYWDTGWKLRFARPVGNHLVGATLYDGVVVQPQMVDSPDREVGTAAHPVPTSLKEGTTTPAANAASVVKLPQ